MDFFPRVIFSFKAFGQTVEITETVIVTWFIMVLLTLVAIYSTRKLKTLPEGLQNGVEIFVEGVEWLIVNTMGEKGRGFIPFIGSLGLFLLSANLIGLATLRPPTSDLSTTLALATIVFVLTQYYGIKERGLISYLKGFARPLPLMLPLNIIGELANPFSMAFRLFGNILGGVIIIGLLYRAAPVLIPVPLHIYFDIFAGIIQTFIFIMLAMVFISMAMD